MPGHKDIRYVPSRSHGHTGTDKDNQSRNDAIRNHKRFAGHLTVKKGQAIIYIKEVTDQCGEGEKDHANGNQNRTERPEIRRQGLLYIGSPGSLFGNGHTRTKRGTSP